MVGGVNEKMRTETMRPVDIGVDAQGIGSIYKLEQVDAVGPGALKVEAAIHLVLAANGLVESRLHHVLMAVIEHWHLVVIERIASNVGQREEREQRLRLGTYRHLVVRKWQA